LQKEKLMHDVAWIKPEAHGLQLITLMGERKLLHAKIKSIDLLNSSIVLEGITANLPRREGDS